MPISITITTESTTTTLGDVDTDTIDEGEDIQVFGGQMFETDAGDIAVTTGVQTTQQSIARGVSANPGSFARRPTWGGGLNGMIFKGATLANRDLMQSRALAQLNADQRVLKVDEVSTSVNDDGVTLNVRAQSISGRVEQQILVKPPGVS